MSKVAEKRRKRKETNRNLIGFHPWSAAGPGWANRGVTFLWEVTYWEGKTAKVEIERENFYDAELPIGWLDVALIAYGRLQQVSKRRR